MATEPIGDRVSEDLLPDFDQLMAMSDEAFRQKSYEIGWLSEKRPMGFRLPDVLEWSAETQGA